MLGQIGRAPFAVPLGQATGEEATPTATESAAGLMSATDKTKLDRLIADWDTTLVGYYMVSTTGVDTADGRIIAAAGSTLTAGTHPVKTWAQLLAIIPPLGAGRSLVILAEPGTYAEDVDLSPILSLGYRSVIVRGSDLTNTATDRVSCGFITAVTGPNGNGSFTVTAGATTTNLPILAGPLVADAGRGFRVRFLTGTLAGQCRNIRSNDTANVVLGLASSGTAANGDTFIIERPGVKVSSLTYAGAGGYSPTHFVGPTIVGIAATGTGGVSISHSSAVMALCAVENTNAAGFIFVTDCTRIDGLQTYTDETGTSRNVGMGLRSAGIVSFNHTHQMTLNAIGSEGAVTLTNIRAGNLFSQGSYAAGAVTVAGCGQPAVDSGVTGGNFTFGSGSAAAAIRTRIVAGGLVVTRSTLGINGVDFTNCTSACIRWGGASEGAVITVDNCSGSSGNTAVGIDLANCVGVRLFLEQSAANTVTGTVGDIKFPSGSILTTHADMRITNVLDNLGNEVIGSAGRVQNHAGLVVKNKTGSALAVGDLVNSQGNSTQVQAAQADSAAHAAGPLLVMVTPPGDNLFGYAVPLGGGAIVNYDAAATTGMAYLSPGTAGKATTTVPPGPAPQQRLRLGVSITTSGTTGRLYGSPEMLPVDASGVA